MTSTPSFFLKFPIFWNKRGKIRARLAAKADANVRYITVTMGSLVDDGLLPDDHGLKHGDVFGTTLNGYFVPFKVNRKNHATSAAHLPDELELPSVNEDGFNAKLYDGVVIGPMKAVEVVAAHTVQSQEVVPTVPPVSIETQTIQTDPECTAHPNPPTIPEPPVHGTQSDAAPASEPSTSQE